LLASCGAAAPAAGAAAIASAVVSRAQGNCYSQCIAGTRCNHDTGMCEPQRDPETQHTGLMPPSASTEVVPSQLRETDDAGVVTPTHEVVLPEGGETFTCTSASGLADDVVADSEITAARVCAEMNGEPCTCAPPVR
jgi:hypothetical protein